MIVRRDEHEKLELRIMRLEQELTELKTRAAAAWGGRANPVYQEGWKRYTATKTDLANMKADIIKWMFCSGSASLLFNSILKSFPQIKGVSMHVADRTL